jgi:hypothetical protein
MVSRLPLRFSTSSEPHFGHVLPTGLSHKVKSQAGYRLQP